MLRSGQRALDRTLSFLVRGARAGSLVGIAVLFAACNGPSVSPGTPQAESSVTSEATITQEAPTSSTSSRPVDIDLTGKDPCTVIDPATLTGLNYRDSGVPGKTGPTKNACSFRLNRTVDGTALFFDTSTGVMIPDRPPTGTVVTPIEVSGYAAYSVQDQQLGGCTVKVDVHDGQTLSTTSTGDASELVAPLCDRAIQFAALTVGVLRGQ